MSRRAAAMRRPKSRSDNVDRRCSCESGGVSELMSASTDGNLRVTSFAERDDRGNIHSVKNADADLVV